MSKRLEKYFLGLAILLISLTGIISYYQVPLWQLFLLKDFSVESIFKIIQNDQEEIGYIEFLQGTEIKRKNFNKISFNEIALKEKIFNKDSLMTGPNTFAKVKIFINQKESILEIEPNTLVSLDFNLSNEGFDVNKMPSISVLSGKIKKDTEIILATKKIDEIKEKNKTIINKIKKERSLANIELSEPTNVVFPPLPGDSIGNEIIINKEPKNNEIIINKPKPLKKQSSKKTKIEVVNLTSSFNGDSSISSNKLKDGLKNEFFVDFTWESDPRASGYQFILKDDNVEVVNELVNQNFYRYKPSKIGSSFDYQIVILNKLGNEIGRSNLLNKKFTYSAPQLKYPENRQIIKNNKELVLTWEKTSFTTSYIIEISKTEDFKKGIRKETVNNFLDIKLTPGTYFWRTRSKYKNTTSQPSEYQVFYLN